MKPDRRLVSVAWTMTAALAIAGCGGSHPPKPPIHLVTLAPTTSTLATAPPVSVPSVAGETATKAEAALRKSGLVPKVVRMFSSTPAGQVIRTSPAGFGSATGGQVVTVYLSEGPPKVTVPGLIGDTQAAALRAITRLGLEAVAITQPGSGHPGDVVAQAPPAHAKVLPATTVEVTVQTAISTVTMPKVLGETEEAAVATLSALGLTISFKARTVVHLKRDHLVLDQAPATGTRLTKGAQVTLTVGVYKSVTGAHAATAARSSRRPSR